MTPQNSCAVCGQENAPDARFCAGCGASLKGAPQPEGGAGSTSGGLPPRSLGDILNATFSIYLSSSRAFVGFIGIALVPQIPATIAGLIQGPASLVLTALGVLLSAVAAGATVYAAAREALGQEWDIASAYTRAFERVISLVFAFLVYLLALIGAGVLSIVLVGIPLLFFILIVWSFHAEAIMIEGKRNLDSLSRSYELVKGSWWRVFGIFVVFLLLAAACFMAAAALVVAVSSIIAYSGVGFILIGAAVVVIMPIMAIGSAVLYLDLRVRKEGYTLDDLAAEVGR